MKLSWRYFDIFHVVPILGTTLSSWKKNLVQYSLKKYFWFWLSVNIRQPRLQQPSQPYAVFHCQRSCSCFVSMLRKREKKGFQSSEQDVLSGPCCLLHQLLKEFLFLIRVADLQLPDAITQQWEQRENECWDRRTCAPIYYNGRDSKVIIYTPSKLQTPPLGEGRGSNTGLMLPDIRLKRQILMFQHYSMNSVHKDSVPQDWTIPFLGDHLGS